MRRDRQARCRNIDGEQYCCPVGSKMRDPGVLRQAGWYEWFCCPKDRIVITWPPNPRRQGCKLIARSKHRQ
jgi:hypothetical protein